MSASATQGGHKLFRVVVKSNAG